MIKGMGGKKYPTSTMHKRVFVGSAKAPIATIERGEIQGYVEDEEFLAYYHCWKRLSSGMGLPYGDGWSQYPELFSTIMELMTRELEGVKRNATI